MTVHQMFRSYAFNYSLIAQITNNDKDDEVAKKVCKIVAGDADKLRAVRKVVFRRCAENRASHAEGIMEPATVFCRSVAESAAPASCGVTLTAQMRIALAKALEKHDFVDTTATETAADRDARKPAVLSAVDQRVSAWLGVHLPTAYVLDPFCLVHAQAVDAGKVPEPGWAPADALQEAKQHVPEQIRAFLSQPGPREVATAEYGHYLQATGAFGKAPYPKVGEAHTREAIMSWWNLAPTRQLHKLATRLAALRLSTHRAETAWAEVSRQLTPSRNRLSAASVGAILDLRYNAHLLPLFQSTALANKIAKKRRSAAKVPAPKRRRGAAGVVDERDESVSSPRGSTSSSSAGSHSGAAGDLAADGSESEEGESAELDWGFLSSPGDCDE
jgi:hypothetical protein